MKKYEQMVWKYLKGNKKRTISTMFGVAFGALLIFAVFHITFCMIRQKILNAEQVYNFDVVFYGLTEDQETFIDNFPGVEAVYGGGITPDILRKAGIVFLDDFENSPYVIRLVDGEYPQNKNEVLINEELMEMNEREIGESVLCSLGTASQTEEMEFVITGIFAYEGDYYGISHYEYSYVTYLGLFGEDSHQQIKDSNAVFVKFKNPYRIKSLSKKISEKTGAEYIINDSIAAYYNQTSDGSEQAVNGAIILFLVVMISLMAIAVIKNTLRISVAERIKDYGVLRCAGASLKQLKKMLIEEAMLIGGISGLVGIVGSYIGLVVFSKRSEYFDFTHFFILAALLTMIVIEVTMWLATIDPCKLLEKLTPAEAVRNQVRSGKKESYKVRKAGLITKIFGIEGAYAYKNAMRSPKQFITKVLSLTIGIIAFICTETICATYMNIALEGVELDKYYNIVVNPNEMGGSWLEEEEAKELYVANQKNLTQAIAELKTLDEIGETVGTYILSISDIDSFIFYHMDASNMESTDLEKRYTEEFKKSRIFHDRYIEAYPSDEADLEAMERYATASYILRNDTFFAYDKELFPMLSDALVEGTCEVEELGDDGIILCNRQIDWIYDPDTETDITYSMEVYNYKVGDQVTFITAPYDEFRKRVQEKKHAFVEQHRGEIPESEWGMGTYEDEEDFLTTHFRYLIRFEVFRDLYEEGYYKTYTIKGILSDDMLISQFELISIGPHYIVSKEQMRELFQGYEEVFYQELGMHVEGYSDDVLEILNKYGFYMNEYRYVMDDYENAKNARDVCDIIIAIVLMFMMINIFNTTASSIVFRKREFAFLRCVGMSKKKLSYMILLESILALIIALALGSLISFVSGYGIYLYMRAFKGPLMVISVPFIRILGVSILLLIIMMLAAWIPLQSIKREIAPSLAEADE